MRYRALLMTCALVAVSACGTPSQRGAALYGEGRYIEAAEVFERTEKRLPESSSTERAEYGLYRGLTFLRLDDLRGARQWLSYTSSVERNNPGLSEAEQRALRHGWAELERRSREQTDGPQPALPEFAESDAQQPRGAGQHANGQRSVRTQ